MTEVEGAVAVLPDGIPALQREVMTRGCVVLEMRGELNEVLKHDTLPSAGFIFVCLLHTLSNPRESRSMDYGTPGKISYAPVGVAAQTLNWVEVRGPYWEPSAVRSGIGDLVVRLAKQPSPFGPVEVLFAGPTSQGALPVPEEVTVMSLRLANETILLRSAVSFVETFTPLKSTRSLVA